MSNATLSPNNKICILLKTIREPYENGHNVNQGYQQISIKSIIWRVMRRLIDDP